MTEVYRGMNRDELDAGYDCTKAIPNFPEVYDEMKRRSEETYGRHEAKRGLAYGDLPRQRYDWFSRPGATSTVIFIHGGYWQSCTKEDFAYVVEGPLARGIDVVLAEYTIGPEATMTQIVDEIRMLIETLASENPQIGGPDHPLGITGHSAGGHLTAMFRAHPAIDYALPISPLVDLEPISLCFLDDNLHITADEIEKLSPIKLIGPGVPTVVAVGADELPELVRHATEYTAALTAAGQEAVLLAVPGHEHFGVLDELAKDDGMITEELVRLATK